MSTLKQAIGDFLTAVLVSGALNHVRQDAYIDQLRALEAATEPLLLGDRQRTGSLLSLLMFGRRPSRVSGQGLERPSDRLLLRWPGRGPRGSRGWQSGHSWCPREFQVRRDADLYELG